MYPSTMSEAPFTLSEILEEEFRVVHDCRGRFFEFHWNNPAHIAERLKIITAEQTDPIQKKTADPVILRKFSEFATLEKDSRKNVEAALRQFTERLNDLAKDPNLNARLLLDNSLQDTEAIRSFKKSQFDTNARLLQCLMADCIHPRSEPATRTGYFMAGDLENAEKLAAELARRFSITNPFTSAGRASEERRKRVILDTLNRLVTQPNMHVTALATAELSEVPAANRILIEACYGDYLSKSIPPDAGKDNSLEEARLAMIYRHIHALAGSHSAENGGRSDQGSERSSGPRVALCLSGGGIRSATYALGILQGLARKGLLKEFHYLSTVSGGGYVGSWLSAWISERVSLRSIPS